MGSCHHPLLIDESSTAENVRSAVRTVISEANLPGKFRRPRSLPTDDARPPTDTAGNTPTILSLLITLLNAKRFDSCEKFQQTTIFILQFVDSWLCSLEIITFLNKATTSYQSLKFIGDIPRHTSSDKRGKNAYYLLLWGCLEEHLRLKQMVQNVTFWYPSSFHCFSKNI